MSLTFEEAPPAPARFAAAVARENPDAMCAVSVERLMLNIGLRCDLACAHCHQSSSPGRLETMSRATLDDALALAGIVQPALIDVTGGEPTLWEHLPELIARARAAGHRLRVRTNLVAMARPETAGLPELFARERVSLLASLPGVTDGAVAAQRGPVLAESLDVLRRLATLGYGAGDTGLKLDLAVNPPLGTMARPEARLTEEFRATLIPLGVRFNTVHAIANVPVGRFARHLQARGDYHDYMGDLAAAFNPAVLGALACRHGIDVAWDGSLSDCDFNLGAGVSVADGPRTLAEALALDAAGCDVVAELTSRRIAFGPHCFACTVGAGSS